MSLHWIWFRYTLWRYPPQPIEYLGGRKGELAKELTRLLQVDFPEMTLNIAYGIGGRPDGARDFVFRIQRIDVYHPNMAPPEVAAAARRHLRRLEPTSLPIVSCLGIAWT